jgi:protein-disulfide isomerase
MIHLPLTRRLFVAGLGAVGVASLAGVARAQDATATADIPDMVLGQPDAPVTIIEYASFTCPHCAEFSATVFPEIRKNYIDTGKVRFVIREVYFDRFGLWASMVARCGGQMRFFGVSDMLFAKQKEWTEGGDPAAIAGNLRRLGLSAGITADQLDACLQDGDNAQALVAWYEKNAKDDNIEATPSFIIDGEKYSNMSYQDFAKVLDEKLSQ